MPHTSTHTARTGARALWLLLLLLTCWYGPGSSPFVPVPGVSVAQAAELRTDFSFARRGDGGVVASLAARIPPGHHAYAHDPGDTGKPARLDFVLENAAEALPVYYPEGAMQRDLYDKNASINVYEGETRIYVLLPEDAAGQNYRATLSLLLCSNLNCTPVDLPLKGRVPAEPGPLDAVPWQAQWLELEARATPVTASADGTGGDFLGTVPLSSAQGPAKGLVPLRDPLADPLADPLSDLPAAPSSEEEGTQELLPAPEGFDFRVEPVYADTSVEIYGLGKALALGILAGLLLNAMPCVLPVLTFKMTSLLMANARDGRSLRRFREHNVFFAAGVLTLFTILALVLGAADLMWGQLYQSQQFILVMLVLVFLLGLSMLGVFTLPVMDFKSLSKTRNPRLQAYLTGLLSTFLATPCSGPLLGGVLGWAFTQSLPVLVVVFWAVGVGMALPYIALSIWPGLAQALPRPGAWMRTFEHVLGFFLLGTALYLLSILPDEKHIPVLFALLVTALAAFLWGQLCGPDAPRARRRVGSAVFVTVIVTASFFALEMERQPTRWDDFEPQAFTQMLGKRPMVVEFTADWCPNCKFVEATVFTEERLKDVRSTYDADFIRVDLTDANAHGAKLLEMLGSRSIPLTALFPAGPNATRPTVLRDVFTGASFDRAAREAFRP